VLAYPEAIVLQLLTNFQCPYVHVLNDACVCFCVFHPSHCESKSSSIGEAITGSPDLQGMGYTAGVANLLSAPPVVFAVITAFSFAWLGDRYRMRGPVIAAQSIICIVGLMITAYHHKHGVRYFGIFLGIAGCQGNIPAVLAYQSNNIRFQSKRSVGSALQIGFGAIGGIIASTTFREVDAPRYVPGLWTTAGLQLLILALLSMTTFVFWRANRKLDRGTLRKPIEGLEGFKYTL
jgi:MFS family permease